jgi:hypothetical protein
MRQIMSRIVRGADDVWALATSSELCSDQTIVWAEPTSWRMHMSGKDLPSTKLCFGRSPNQRFAFDKTMFRAKPESKICLRQNFVSGEARIKDLPSTKLCFGRSPNQSPTHDFGKAESMIRFALRIMQISGFDFAFGKSKPKII